MFLNCHVQVFINGVKLDSVVSIETHNDGNHIGSYCDIVLPLNSRIESNDTVTTAPTRFLFNTGDYIIINAKYDGYESLGDDGDWQRIFEGFLYDFYETTPIKIKCYDFIYWFNIGIYGADSVKGGIGKHFDSIDFSDLLQDIVSWTNTSIANYNSENNQNFPAVSLIKPDMTLTLIDITFGNMSAAAVLEWLKRELGFNISLIGNQLYANVASFTRNQVKLDTGKNVIQSNLQSTNLKNRKSRKSKGANSVFLRLKVKAYFENDNGTKESIEVGDPNGQLREVYFYKVAKGGLTSIAGYPKPVYDNYYNLAMEALNKCYQARYTGEVETYLYPKITLFDRITYIDTLYTERNGDYVATLVKETINENGYHRHVKLALVTNYNIVQTANG